MYIFQTVQIKTEAGLSPTTKTFWQIAKGELSNMAQAIVSGVGKRTYRDYTFAINKYLIPFFGNYMIENITAEMVRDFEGWRIAMMGKIPMASTKRNHSSAYVSIRYGTQMIELAKGKYSIEVESAQALIKALETVKQAVESGELDNQITNASINVRKVFDK